MDTRTQAVAPRVTIGDRQGRPVLLVDGDPYFYTAYFLRHVVDRDGEGRLSPMTDRDEYVRQLAHLCRPFAQRGIHGYEVPVNIGWNGPNDWDSERPKYLRNGEPALDQFRAITQADPEARMMVNFLIHAPEAWKERFPDEFELDDEGNSYEVSIGSDSYLDELLENLPRFIRFVEESPFAPNVLTYFFSYGHEGFTWSTLRNAVTDFSPAMHRCFRNWLREKYRDVADLRQAWRDTEATFENAGVPTRQEQLASDLGWFRDPTGSQKVFDYIQCRVDRFVNTHYRIAHAIKDACNYRVPVYCFGAYLQVTGWPGCYWFDDVGMRDKEFSPHALSVQTGWGRIIDCPDIDGWESPYDYYYRQMGGVALNQSIEESMRLRGKTFQVNEDTRTFLAHQAGDVYGTVATREETTAVHRRNFGAIASHWSGCNWMEQINNWLQDDGVLDELGRYDRLLQRSIDWPETPVDAIGVFIDEQSIRYEKPLIALDWDLIYKQRVFGLSHCGVPFRCHLLDDLALENMPEYKCNLLLNCFYMDSEREAMVAEKLKRDGKTLVWMVAPGFCHAAEGLSLSSMQRLVGMKFAKCDLDWDQWITISNFAHSITHGLSHDLMYGSNARIGPVFYVDDPDVTVLGRRLLFQGRHEPALTLKEMNSHSSIYSAAPLLPSDLLRNIARYAGCHVYTDENDVVMVGRGLITYHTSAPGERILRLPTPAAVHDLFTGDLLSEGSAEIAVDFKQPGTRVLTTLPPEAWR
ncbi:MAG: hypothetical protein GW893_08295 [Armatimonadetes bacterium]|nr:hypothetical protein [Armatimonadota bacterium]PIX41175.1 MAG: hypothetical protein COZ56_12705 [Armatimonadetes bacterium CG_4_8_14_3_um_filter_58_9]PIY43076.1 MAG: hypothetical protein COZ05_12205 [Armatimonadetes bacterium CG_4_10_14_3_um_filter_59_10]PJB68754.1 MAG: hypothetical protein CO095_10825 [Armatimonadetes bacterium CG_4_9_14_3_um_filter_58_7]